MSVRAGSPPLQFPVAPGLPTHPLTLIAGVADFKISADPGAHIVTYALGSCLGITFHDPVRTIGALLHVMLPDSALHGSRATRPEMFVNTGVPLVLDELARLGAKRGDLRCKVFGGARLMKADRFFRIGAKNVEAFAALSRELGLEVVAWEVDGTVNRTIRLVNHTGDVVVRCPAQPPFVR